MLLNTDYLELGEVPSTVLKDLQTLAHTVDWNKDDFYRKENILTTRIVRVPYGVRKELPQEQTKDVKSILEKFQPIDQWMHSIYTDHTFIKCEIACLLPGDELNFHVDLSWWHQHGHRIHVPVISNPESFWCVEDREHYFSVGKYYEVNNRRYHTYCNRGTTFRLHLVFDIIENRIYNQALENGTNIENITFDTELLPRDQLMSRLDELKKQTYY